MKSGRDIGRGVGYILIEKLLTTDEHGLTQSKSFAILKIIQVWILCIHLRRVRLVICGFVRIPI